MEGMEAGLASLHLTKVDPPKEMGGLRQADGGALELVVEAAEAVDRLPAGDLVVVQAEVLHLRILQTMEDTPAPGPGDA